MQTSFHHVDILQMYFQFGEKNGWRSEKIFKPLNTELMVQTKTQYTLSLVKRRVSEQSAA